MEEPTSAGWFYRLSPRLVIRTRQSPPGGEAGERVLLIAGGGAFPPGHPTTRLCLDLLQPALAAVGIMRLLDVGCGSGILGLAAAALGVPRVVGVDLAPQAARITRKNARDNGLAVPVAVVQGSTECLQGHFDLVLANLPWEVQLDKAAELDRLAAPAGRLILSGFRDNQETALRESYGKLGWSVQQRLVRDFSHPELPPDLSFTWVAWLLDKGGRGE